MIHSTSNTSGQQRPDAVGASNRKPAAPAGAPPVSGETLSSAGTDALRAALAATPEVRPEEVQKGKSLAVDASYPPRAIIEDLARLFIQSQDASRQD